MKKILVYCLLIVFTLAAACTNSEEEISDSELLDQSIDNLENAQSFEATALMTMNVSNLMSLTYNMEIIYQHPDKSYTKLEMHLEGEHVVVELLADGDSLQVHAPHLPAEMVDAIYQEGVNHSQYQQYSNLFAAGGHDNFEVVDNAPGLGSEYKTFRIEADTERLTAMMQEDKLLEQELLAEDVDEEQLAEIQDIIDKLYAGLDATMITTAVVNTSTRQFHSLDIALDFSIPLGDIIEEWNDPANPLPSTLRFQVVMRVEYKSFNQPVSFPKLGTQQ